MFYPWDLHISKTLKVGSRAPAPSNLPGYGPQLWLPESRWCHVIFFVCSQWEAGFCVLASPCGYYPVGH